MCTPIYDRFAEALLAPAGHYPGDLFKGNESQLRHGFAAYRNNVIGSLIQALASRFPVTHTLVGEAFFQAMAAQFIHVSAPQSPMLADYGDGLAAFVAGFEPAASVPYLADVVRLETARSQAYHAADAPPLAAAALAAVPAQQLLGLRLTLHPAARVVRSAWPILTLWEMNTGARPWAELDHWRGEHVLVARPHLNVVCHRLGEGQAMFLHALGAHLTLSQACEQAQREHPGFNLEGAMVCALQAGVFLSFS
ncbi:DNA-binding domain-containing protein [Pseudomonas typographi]|uniref:DUF2063 domain-containing protein n=1 Tax=Pseudomonas typographi TaxID=2715964 RepID=A0ABR7Z2K8_9PSED|nr:DNA-binding domain-containing protein [Pseudomonas typographi]MBD1599628.1 DUF2063 domain-containing protein [Pseudomonas typographi]